VFGPPTENKDSLVYQTSLESLASISGSSSKVKHMELGGGEVREVTEQQKLFVDEYLRLRKKNATQAAINAGYSLKSASSQASQLLKNPKVIKYLKAREKAIIQELQEEFIFDALEARKVMYSIMKDPTAENRDKINVAKDFLDRAGFKPIDKVEHSGDMNINNPLKDLTTEELKKLIK
jgi:phage terminase small subunit